MDAGLHMQGPTSRLERSQVEIGIYHAAQHAAGRGLQQVLALRHRSTYDFREKATKKMMQRVLS